MAQKDWIKINQNKWTRKDGEDEIGIFESDEELKKQSNGEKYFVPYAHDTKMKMFKTKSQAISFIMKYMKEY